MAAALALTSTCAVLLPAAAATFNWFNQSGIWSTAGNWMNGNAPSGADPTDVLVFGDLASSPPPSYTATNDFALPTPFVVNTVKLQADTSSVTIGGNPLALAGINPQIVQNGAAAATITAPFNFSGTFGIGGTGSGAVTMAGAVSGNASIVKTGAFALDFGSPVAGTLVEHTFHGGLVVNGGSITFSDPTNAETALRANALTLAAGTSIVSGAELRFGEVSGSGSITAQDPITGNGQDIVLSLLGNGTFSGSITSTPVSPATRKGSFFVRGLGAQTLTGSVLQINNELTIGRGATLVLAGNAAIPAANTSALVALNGGSFVLDNSGTNNPNRLPDAGLSASLDTRGGGTFSLIGNAAGSSETLGSLQLGSQSNARSGAVTINVTPAAGATGATVLTFQTYTRDSKDTPRDTVNFTATDSAGNPLTLGQAGSNPRILFTSIPSVNNGLLSETAAPGTTLAQGHIGWATVNGSDFATYTSGTGIGPVIATTVSGTLASNTALNAKLAGSGMITSAGSDVFLNSLKIQPSASGQSLTIASSGSLGTNAILLAGNFDYSIVNAGAGIGGISDGAAVAGVTGGSRYFQVQSAVLTVGVTLAAPDSSGKQNSITKAGAGTLVLSGNNTTLAKTLTINEGTARVTPAGLPVGKIELRGGVLELTGMSSYTATIGTADGNVNWGDSSNVNDRGSGGFSAFGGPVTVNLISGNGDNNIFWEDTNFVNSGYALVFGSTRSDSRITLTDNLSLTQAPPAVSGGTNDFNFNLREIRVIDNPSSATDFTRFSGIITGSVRDDLLKTGNGILELTGVNTFTGGVVVAEGSLLTNNASGLGAANGAYILLGSRSGSASSALLTSNTSGTVSIAREIDVLAGTTGNAILGNTTAPGAASAGNAIFSGNIVLGTDGSNVNRRLQLTAESGTSVTVSGGIAALGGYNGVIDVEKIGTGAVTLSGVNTYTGPTTVSAGALLVNGSISGSAATIKSGATLGGNGSTGALSVLSGGLLSPGDVLGHTSVLTTGGVTFADSTAQLSIEIGGVGAGGDNTLGYDALNVTGSVTLNNATLQAALLNGFVLPANDLLFLINNDGSDPVQGTFAGLSDGAQFPIGSETFQISYFGNSSGDSFTGGNDVVLRAAPEPASGTLALAAAALLGLRRRRSKE